MLDYEDEISGSDVNGNEGEGHESESARMEDVLLPLTYFDHAHGSNGYKCKQDLINRVKLFHEISRRSMRVMTSNSRRYSVKCTLPNCKFKLNFHFGYEISFCKPKNAI